MHTVPGHSVMADDCSCPQPLAQPSRIWVALHGVTRASLYLIQQPLLYSHVKGVQEWGDKKHAQISFR
jgi:hypothetical protein